GAEDKQVITRACPRCADLVESGVLEGPQAEAVVAPAISEAIDAGADTLVLGCTHFSFLAPTIARLAGDGVDVIDPAPAVARQTARVSRDSAGEGGVTLAASCDLDELAGLVTRMVSWPST